jgi:aconitate hydratase
MREIREVITTSLSPELYKQRYSNALEGDEKWRGLKSATGEVYAWDEKSTYIREPPWFEIKSGRPQLSNVNNARVLAVFEDRVTTDHISPAGSIPSDSPAGIYLQEHDVPRIQFSTYGSRRGNHEIMVRGGFSNIRLRNLLGKGKEGGWTTHYPSEELMTIYDAALRYQAEGIPLIILAGKQYGAGSSRDWAAKAVKLLGVRAVIAESFERIHRSNLVAMGVLPLEFFTGQTCKSLGLQGDEEFDIKGIVEIQKPQPRLSVTAKSKERERKFEVIARLDNEVELEYYRDGGVLPYVFAKLTA